MPARLMALTGLGSNTGLKGGFQLDQTGGHAMRLNSRTDREGSPVSSLNCDRPLHIQPQAGGLCNGPQH